MNQAGPSPALRWAFWLGCAMVIASAALMITTGVRVPRTTGDHLRNIVPGALLIVSLLVTVLLPIVFPPLRGTRAVKALWIVTLGITLLGLPYLLCAEWFVVADFLR